MRKIILEVNDNAAERYLRMSETERKTVSKEFSRFLIKRRTMLEVMDDLGEQAKRNGLTPEILDELLKNK